MYNLRIGIVGCGRMGRVRAVASSKLGAQIVVACDTKIQVAKELAASFPDCQVVEDARDLNWASVDAVFICTPPFARGPVEIAAINADVSVFMEKPVGLSVEQCAPVQRALEARPVITAVGYMNRYRNSVQQARRALIGKTILGASCSWVVGGYQVPWWRQIEMSGGPINEQAAHLVDLARYLVGDIIEVHGIAHLSTEQGELIETASFNLRFADGPLCSIFYSCKASRKMVSFQVFASDMRVHLEGWDFQLLEDGTNTPLPLPDSERSAIFHKEVAAYFEAISGSSTNTILCDFEDAVKTQCILDSLNLSIKSGKIQRVQ